MKLDNIRIELSVVLINCMIAILLLVFSYTLLKNNVDNTISKFNNSEIIICNRTLIITNDSWKLVGHHLINNIAGHIDISECVVKG